MNKTNTILGQLLEGIKRPEFEKLVKQHKTDKYCKGFTTWTHFTSMLFAQLSGQSGLRSISGSLNQQKSSLYHLGIHKEIRRSTLSYANNNRSAAFFEDLFFTLLDHCSISDQKTFPFKNRLFAIDATTISLCLTLFNWAQFRQKKAGIKLHTQFDIKKQIPTFVQISTAKKHENATLKEMHLQSGDIAVFDKGYVNYEQFAQFSKQGIFFVTRLKDNALYRVVEKRHTSPNGRIISDQIIRFTGLQTAKRCPQPLRRVISIDEKTGESITILSNLLDIDAQVLSDIYRQRWQIELFFKAIKQNLSVKRFYGTSENAVRIQIWIALIVFLLFSILKNESAQFQNSFTRFISQVSVVLFQRRDLRLWLSGDPPPSAKPAHILEFDFL